MAIKRLYDTLVGATVNVNQLMPISSTSRSANIQGVTFVDNRDGSYTFYTGENGASATATFSIISKIDGGSPQHVYYLKGNAEGSSISTWYLTDQYNGAFDYDFKKENIVKVLRDTPTRLDLRVVVASGTVISAPVTIKPQVIDLTDYFNSASIADYLYNLETATAGAGVAKLREWGFFTGEYIPYNPGSLESVQATAHVMREADDNIIGNYDLGTDTLRGLFKLDSNNNLYADGDRKTSDGTITRYYGTRAYQSGDESLADAITDGTTTMYKLTTPTTEQSTPFTSPQVCYPDGTEEYVTNNGIPVGHETRYQL